MLVRRYTRDIFVYEHEIAENEDIDGVKLLKKRI
jgi:hypothetical protein